MKPLRASSLRAFISWAGDRLNTCDKQQSSVVSNIDVVNTAIYQVNVRTNHSHIIVMMITNNWNSRTFKTLFHQTGKLSRHDLAFKDFPGPGKWILFGRTFKDLWPPCKCRQISCSSNEWLGFHVPLDTLQVISETTLSMQSLGADTKKINSKNFNYNKNQNITIWWIIEANTRSLHDTSFCDNPQIYIKNWT